MIVKCPSLETRWIRPMFKQVSQPVVVWDEQEENASGLYYHPAPEEVCIAGCNVPQDKGIIVIGSYNSEVREAGSTIAHEWRHHLQTVEFGWTYDGIGWNKPPMEPKEYERKLTQFFRRSRSEADALRFQLKAEPTPVGVYFDELARRTDTPDRKPPTARKARNGSFADDRNR